MLRRSLLRRAQPAPREGRLAIKNRVHAFAEIPEDLETLAELIPFVSRDDANQVARPVPTASVEQVQQCYRARFEAAEARYGRMKALVCASLEEQMRLRSQICGQKVMEEMRCLNQNQKDFLLGNRSAHESARREMVRHVWELLEQMRCLKEENARLKEMNARLRSVRKYDFASFRKFLHIFANTASQCFGISQGFTIYSFAKFRKDSQGFTN